jgi:hypothetical protein
MDLNLLATLKQKLAADRDLPSIVKYFFDHFGDDPAFTDIGHKTHNEMVDAFLAEASFKWFEKKIMPNGLTLVSIPEHHFIHGGCILGTNLVNLIYFDDILTILIVLAPGGKYKNTQFMRASARQMPQGYAAEN